MQLPLSATILLSLWIFFHWLGFQIFLRLSAQCEPLLIASRFLYWNSLSPTYLQLIWYFVLIMLNFLFLHQPYQCMLLLGDDGSGNRNFSSHAPMGGDIFRSTGRVAFLSTYPRGVVRQTEMEIISFLHPHPWYFASL